MSEAVTVPSLMMMISISFPEIACKGHTHTDTHTHTARLMSSTLEFMQQSHTHTQKKSPQKIIKKKHHECVSHTME